MATRRRLRPLVGEAVGTDEHGENRGWVRGGPGQLEARWRARRRPGCTARMGRVPVRSLAPSAPRAPVVIIGTANIASRTVSIVAFLLGRDSNPRPVSVAALLRCLATDRTRIALLAEPAIPAPAPNPSDQHRPFVFRHPRRPYTSRLRLRRRGRATYHAATDWQPSRFRVHACMAPFGALPVCLGSARSVGGEESRTATEVHTRTRS